jgi:hypothetical protein
MVIIKFVQKARALIAAYDNYASVISIVKARL